MKKLRVTVLLAAVLGWAGWTGMSAQEKDKTEEQAKQACEKFARAIFSKDLDGVMKLVTVPWYDNEDNRKGRVIQDVEELRKALKKIMADIPESPKDVSLEVLDNLTYEKALAKTGDQIKPELRKMLDMVLKKTDRMLNVRPHIDGKKGSRLILMVGWREGQAKVIGTHDP